MIGLNPFQEHLLEAFFARETGFFLTGATALAGYHLHHRVTENLELCTLEDRVRVGEAALLEAASDAGANEEDAEVKYEVGGHGGRVAFRPPLPPQADARIDFKHPLKFGDHFSPSRRRCWPSGYAPRRVNAILSMMR